MIWHNFEGEEYQAIHILPDNETCRSGSCSKCFGHSCKYGDFRLRFISPLPWLALFEKSDFRSLYVDHESVLEVLQESGWKSTSSLSGISAIASLTESIKNLYSEHGYVLERESHYSNFRCTQNRESARCKAIDLGFHQQKEEEVSDDDAK